MVSIILSQKNCLLQDIFLDHISRSITEYQKQHLIKRYIEGKIISGKREGIWLTFSEKGNLLFKTFYKNGSHNGIWESYHDNGNIKLKGNY